MLLPLEDVEHFFRLHRSLMFFVNQRLKVLDEDVADPEAYAHLPAQARVAVHEALLAHRELIDAFADEIEQATRERLDFKSELQERLARDGETVSYEIANEVGPPHDRRFEIRATVRGDELGIGSGRSKKEAEQAAAERALERLRT